MLDFIDLDDFQHSEKKVTLLKLNNTSRGRKINATNALDNINLCCPEHKESNTEELLQTVNDTMPRIPCDISRDDFMNRYVKRREPVILVNCTKEWIAQTRWTVEKLLGEKHGKLHWENDFRIKDKTLQKFEKKSTLSGKFLSNILNLNGTVRVFDQIARRKHTEERMRGIVLNTDKMHLFSDYDKPRPVPVDFYEKAGILTDYQWVIISQKDTGL